MTEEELKAATAAIEKECNQWLEPNEVASMGIAHPMARDFARAALEAAENVRKLNIRARGDGKFNRKGI